MSLAFGRSLLQAHKEIRMKLLKTDYVPTGEA